jgi:hypothetical protein
MARRETRALPRVHHLAEEQHQPALAHGLGGADEVGEFRGRTVALAREGQEPGAHSTSFWAQMRLAMRRLVPG